ncbi:MAG: hypothetical protein HY707_02145 [Ignavibacteriae bacterium]|nr:hypothetical protein [Ignavibacteriota bacterium]
MNNKPFVTRVKVIIICSICTFHNAFTQHVDGAEHREWMRKNLFQGVQQTDFLVHRDPASRAFQASESPSLAEALACLQNAFSRQAKTSPEKKSVGMAVLYSLLLPGMGELYAGNYSTGKYFTIVEGALWLTLGSLHWYATWLQDDARRFAVQHAQISLDGKGDQYFVDIGNFASVYKYNEAVLRGRDDFKVYDPTSSFYWNWGNDLNRETYRELRVASDERFNDTRFVAAAIGVNHLISAINAARLTISHNKNIAKSDELYIRANVIGGIAHPHGIAISVSKNF